MFAEKYRQAFAGLGLDLKPEHGMDLAPHAGILDRLAAPVALRDYYEICGLHEINRLRNRLLPPEALAIRDGRLVFLAEEQECAFWGAARSGATDPQVWQGVAVVADPNLHWFDEALLLSDFIIAMWRWELTGEEPIRP
ncbi:hypothetical protein [Roseibium salinum]|uniref:SMI1/KNR4 family protein n=1 Tax=Roseibium salinum TaxID=1604349 RepID=A0ABT3R4V3_9HYPH|nr:hypothetical protein [Roseibium sp. DSM 29163]MCX2724213.1 hypothetical protein [Roseibium sp. DSM 29163]